ncbi:hypothetical protein HAX54_042853 [Datura stramonium]|uniref:Uncharacterized protein n=1 Tax=Datura stramonium TaxID=4076 RepID=A0ABS8W3R9_DATST|nr:hypothetical protein [Datura stramonium]
MRDLKINRENIPAPLVHTNSRRRTRSSTDFSGWEAVGLTEKREGGSTIFLFVCFGGFWASGREGRVVREAGRGVWGSGWSRREGGGRRRGEGEVVREIVKKERVCVVGTMGWKEGFGQSLDGAGRFDGLLGRVK